MATVDYFVLSHVWGWWQVEPDACRTPIGGNLDTDLDYYYYAYDTSGGTWTGGVRFCVDPNDAFDFNDEQDSNCATGTRRNFKSIDTRDNTDFTVTLTD